MKKVRLCIYSITVILVYWSVYCNNQMQGLNIYKLSIEMGNFIVNTYKYFYIACFIFLVVSMKFIMGDVEKLKKKLSEKSAKVKEEKASKKQTKENKKVEVANVVDEPLIVCAKCGNSNKTTSKFCQKCGEKIEATLGEVK